MISVAAWVPSSSGFQSIPIDRNPCASTPSDGLSMNTQSTPTTGGAIA